MAIMMRSLATFATIDAAATQAHTASAFHIPRSGTVSPSTGNPSDSTYPGSTSNRATARLSPLMSASCMPNRSHSSASTRTHDTANALSMMMSNSRSRLTTDKVLESASPSIRDDLRSSRITEAATKGPAQAPLPASSHPATGPRPALVRALSWPIRPGPTRTVTAMASSPGRALVADADARLVRG